MFAHFYIIGVKVRRSKIVYQVATEIINGTMKRDPTLIILKIQKQKHLSRETRHVLEALNLIGLSLLEGS